MVLDTLCEPPFKLLESVYLKVLSYNTALLIALASAKRVGDLHMLSIHPSCLEFAPGDSKVMLRPKAAFAPKVIPMSFELFHFSPPPFASSKQRRLHGLCPVGVLSMYMGRTKDTRVCDQLFVCFTNPTQGRALSK